MDIDSPPQKQSFHLTSRKRPRSPDSVESWSDGEHPAKRPNLALRRIVHLETGIHPSGELVFPGGNPTETPKPGYTSRKTTEDWVKSTTGLSLDSPLQPMNPSMPELASATPRGDTTVVGPVPGTHTTLHLPEHPHIIPEIKYLPTPCDSPRETVSSLPQLRLAQSGFSASTDSLHLRAAKLDLSTPTNIWSHGLRTLGLPSMLATSATQPETLTAEDEVMGSPQPGSPVAIMQDKRKVFIGFRPDCAKCQEKVPGHYMHYL